MSPDAAASRRTEETGSAAAVLARAARAHWILLVLAVVVALCGAAFAESRRSLEYQATAEILVTPVDQDDETFFTLDVVRASSVPARTTATAAALLKSTDASQRTAEELGEGWTADRVSGAVTVQPLGDSDLIGVTATAGDPRLAARLANSFATATLEARFDKLSRQLAARSEQIRNRKTQIPKDDYEGQKQLSLQLNDLEGIRQAGRDPSLSLGERASVQGAPTGPPAWAFLAAGGVIGLILGTLAAAALEGLNRRIRDEDEVLHLYPIPILARVPRVDRARNGGLTPSDLTPAAREAFRMLRDELEQRRPRPRTIVVTSASAGDGKTTAAANLAAALAGAAYSVILMDVDIRKPQLAELFHVDPSHRGLAPLLRSEAELHELLVAVPDFPGLSLLAAKPSDGVFLETLMRRLPEIVTEAQSRADYVVIDTAPLGEVSDALGLASKAEDVVLVVRPGHTDRRRFEHVRDVLERADASPTGMVLTGQSLSSKGSYYVYGSQATAASPEKPAGRM